MLVFFSFLALLITATINPRPVIWFVITVVITAVNGWFISSVFVFQVALFILLAFLLIFHVGPIRQLLFTKLFYGFAKKSLPVLSNREIEALNAGDVWWEKELISGNPDFDKLLDFPKASLSEEEQSFIDNQVERLCQLINDYKIVHIDGVISSVVWDYIKQEKFLGLIIPKSHGGLQFSPIAHSTIITKIASRSISVAVTIMVPNSLGPAELLLEYGTKEQQNKYLPNLAVGIDIPCFALTAPTAGSDASNIPDTGVVEKNIIDGKEVIGIRLNFNKRYITLAPIATLIGVAFKLSDPDHLIGDKDYIGITLALVKSSLPGVRVGDKHSPLGLAFLNGPLYGKDVLISPDDIIGGVAMAGQGWRMLMECLSIGRAISLPALSTAGAKVAYLTSSAYAKIRKQFNVSLSDFEGIQRPLAEIGGLAYLMDATRILTASALNEGIKPTLASAISKYHLTEMNRKVVNHAMDIHAGKGIQLGESNYLGNLYISLPVSITVEGANILTRNLIIFGQGILRTHPFLQSEFEALKHNDFKSFDALIYKHGLSFVANAFRALFSPIYKRVITTSQKDPLLSVSQRELRALSVKLAYVADMSLVVLRGGLKQREALSARLGDMLSNLYMMSALIKYYHDSSKHPEEILYYNWAFETSVYEYKVALKDLIDNFPSKLIGLKMRFFTFFFGIRTKKPTDELAKRLVTHMSKKCVLRDKVGRFCYMGDARSPIGQLEMAFNLIDENKDANRLLVSAIKSNKIDKNLPPTSQVEIGLEAGILTDPQAKGLLKVYAIVDKIIQVDDDGMSEVNLREVKVHS